MIGDGFDWMTSDKQESKAHEEDDDKGDVCKKESFDWHVWSSTKKLSMPSSETHSATQQAGWKGTAGILSSSASISSNEKYHQMVILPSVEGRNPEITSQDTKEADVEANQEEEQKKSCQQLWEQIEIEVNQGQKSNNKVCQSSYLESVEYEKMQDDPTFGKQIQQEVDNISNYHRSIPLENKFQGVSSVNEVEKYQITTNVIDQLRREIIERKKQEEITEANFQKALQVIEQKQSDILDLTNKNEKLENHQYYSKNEIKQLTEVIETRNEKISTMLKDFDKLLYDINGFKQQQALKLNKSEYQLEEKMAEVKKLKHDAERNELMLSLSEKKNQQIHSANEIEEAEVIRKKEKIINRLEEEIIETKQHKEKAEGKLQQSIQNAKEKQDEVEELINNNEKLRIHNDNFQNKITRMKKLIELKEKGVAEFHDELKNVLPEIRKFKQLNRSSNTELDKAKTLLTEKDTEIERAKAFIFNLMKSDDEKERILVLSEKKNQQMFVENEIEKAEIIKEKEQAIIGLHKSINHLKNEKEEMHFKLQQSSQTVAQKQKDIKDVIIANEALEHHQSESNSEINRLIVLVQTKEDKISQLLNDADGCIREIQQNTHEHSALTLEAKIMKELLKEKEAETEKLRNDIEGNKTTHILVQKKNREIVLTNEIEKREIIRKQERLQEEIVEIKQEDEKLKRSLHHSFQEAKEKQNEIEELVNDNEKLKLASISSQHKVKRLSGLIELKEDEIVSVHNELNKTILERKNYEQLHRASTVDMEKMKASLIEKQNGIVDLTKDIGEKERDLDESNKRNQQNLLEIDIEKAGILKENEEIVSALHGDIYRLKNQNEEMNHMVQQGSHAVGQNQNKIRELINEADELKYDQSESKNEIKRLKELGQAKEDQTSQLINDANEFLREIEQYKQEHRETSVEINTVKEILQQKEAEVEKLRNDVDENKHLLSLSEKNNQKILSANEIEKDINVRKNNDIINCLKEEIFEIKQYEESTKNELQQAIQNAKEKQNEIKELIDEKEKLKLDSMTLQNKVKRLSGLIELKEDEIVSVHNELNETALESKKYEQLHRASAVDMKKMKASLIEKQNEIVDLMNNIGEKQRDLDESNKRNQRILSEKETEKAGIIRNSEEVISQLQKYRSETEIEKCGIIDQLQKDVKKLQIQKEETDHNLDQTSISMKKKQNEIKYLINENVILKNKQSESKREIKRFMDLGQANEDQTSQLINDANEFLLEIEKYKHQNRESNMEVKAMEEVLKEKESDIERVKNEFEENKITLDSVKKESRETLSACEVEKTEIIRNNKYITSRLTEEIAEIRQSEEESKIELQRAIQNTKEQHNKVGEQIDYIEKLKTDCDDSKNKVKRLTGLIQLKEGEIESLHDELNKVIPDIEKMKQLHRSSTTELDKTKALITEKEDEIVDLMKTVEEKQQALNSSERKKQQRLSENESERAKTIRKNEEIVVETQKEIKELQNQQEETNHKLQQISLTAKQKQDETKDLINEIEKMESHQSESKNEIKRLLDLTQKKEEQSAQLINEAGEHIRKIEKYKQERSELIVEVKRLKEELKQQKANVEELRNDVDKKTILLSLSEKKNQEIVLANQLERTESIRKNKNVINELREEIVELKHYEVETKNKLQQALQNAKEKEGKISELSYNTEVLKSGSDDSQNKAERLTELIKLKDKDIEELQNKMHKSTSENKRVKHIYQATMDESKGLLSIMESEIADLTKDAISKQNALNISENKNQQILTESKIEIAETLRENEEVKGQLQKNIQQLKIQKEELSRELEHTSCVVQNKNNEVEDLTNNTKELKNHRSESIDEIKRLMQVIHIKEEQASQFLRDSNESLLEIEKYKDNWKELANELKTTKEELKQKEDKLENLMEDAEGNKMTANLSSEIIRKNENVIKLLQSDIVEIRRHEEFTENKLEQAIQNVNGKQDENVELINGIEKLKIHCNTSENRIKRLEGLIQINDDDITALHNELHKTLSDNEKYKQLHQTSTAELNNTKALLKEKEVEIADLTKNVEEKELVLNVSLSEKEAEKIENIRRNEKILLEFQRDRNRLQNQKKEDDNKLQQTLLTVEQKKNNIEDLINEIEKLKNYQSDSKDETNRLMDLTKIKEDKISLLLENKNEFLREIEQYKQERSGLTVEVKSAKELLIQKEAEIGKLVHSIGEMQSMVVSLTSKMEKVCLANSKNSQINMNQLQNKIEDMKKQKTWKENELRNALESLKQKGDNVESLVNENQRLSSCISSSELNANRMVELSKVKENDNEASLKEIKELHGKIEKSLSMQRNLRFQLQDAKEDLIEKEKIIKRLMIDNKTEKETAIATLSKAQQLTEKNEFLVRNKKISDELMKEIEEIKGQEKNTANEQNLDILKRKEDEIKRLGDRENTSKIEITRLKETAKAIEDKNVALLKECKNFLSQNKDLKQQQEENKIEIENAKELLNEKEAAVRKLVKITEENEQIMNSSEAQVQEILSSNQTGRIEMTRTNEEIINQLKDEVERTKEQGNKVQLQLQHALSALKQREDEVEKLIKYVDNLDELKISSENELLKAKEYDITSLLEEVHKLLCEIDKLKQQHRDSTLEMKDAKEHLKELQSTTGIVERNVVLSEGVSHSERDEIEKLKAIKTMPMAFESGEFLGIDINQQAPTLEKEELLGIDINQQALALEKEERFGIGIHQQRLALEKGEPKVTPMHQMDNSVGSKAGSALIDNASPMFENERENNYKYNMNDSIASNNRDEGSITMRSKDIKMNIFDDSMTCLEHHLHQTWCTYHINDQSNHR